MKKRERNELSKLRNQARKGQMTSKAIKRLAEVSRKDRMERARENPLHARPRPQ